MTLRYSTRSIVLAGGSLALLAVSADAALTPFTDLGSWSAAAAGPVKVEDFNDEAVADLPAGGTLNVDGFSILYDSDGTTDDAGIRDGAAFGNVDGTNFFEGFTANPEATYVLTFDIPITAFSGEWSGATTGASIALGTGGESLSLIDFIGQPGDGFFGFASDTAFTELLIFDDDLTFGEIFGLDNVRWVEIPSPSTAGVLAIAGVAALRRRR